MSDKEEPCSCEIVGPECLACMMMRVITAANSHRPADSKIARIVFDPTGIADGDFEIFVHDECKSMVIQSYSSDGKIKTCSSCSKKIPVNNVDSLRSEDNKPLDKSKIFIAGGSSYVN